MNFILFVLEIIFFVPFVIWTIYFVVYAISYRVGREKSIQDTSNRYRYLVVFPAYKEDTVIEGSIANFLNQSYSRLHYDLVVVADDMKESTLAALNSKCDRVLIPNYTKRSKAAALKLAMSSINIKNYDAICILDADNHVDTDFLEKVNAAFDLGYQAIQAHRVAKNENSDIAYLDGLSEELNNSILRQGHNSLGVSSALSGSGMVFEINWFLNTILKIDAVGEDKELEYYLLKDRVYTVYLNNVFVYDEKVSRNKDMSNQRKRWIAAQVDVFLKVLKEFWNILLDRNWALCDKLIQWSIPPRVILFSWGPICTLIVFFISTESVYKWLVTLLLFVISLFLALPNRYYNKRTCFVFLKLPSVFVAVLQSFIGLGNARTTFIHTPHGEENDNH